VAQPSYVVGLDLGQASDPTALAVAEVTQGPDPLRKGAPASHYAFRHLERYELGTPYVDQPGRASVAASVQALLSRPPLPGCQLAVDQTGVGRAVVDVFRALGLPCTLWAVTVTSGAQAGQEGLDLRVPKKELVGVMVRLLQTGRLTVAAGLPLAATLAREMSGFRVKITAAANETFGEWRTGQHDDLVFAVALACWLGEKFPPFTRGSVVSGGGPAKAPPGVFGGGRSFTGADARRPPKTW
jgi:hypothetical protein